MAELARNGTLIPNHNVQTLGEGNLVTADPGQALRGGAPVVLILVLTATEVIILVLAPKFMVEVIVILVAKGTVLLLTDMIVLVLTDTIVTGVLVPGGALILPVLVHLDKESHQGVLKLLPPPLILKNEV